jgi:Ala-tRNA(Pro) deacylase
MKESAGYIFRFEQVHDCNNSDERIPMATTYDLLKYLSTSEAEYSLLTHESVNSAQERARALHISAHIAVQTILIKVNGHCWMVVIPASQTINFNSIRRVLGSNSVQICDAADWNMYFPNAEINTIPPFGNLYGISVLVDASLEQGRRIVFGAFSHTQSVFMRWGSYASMVSPMVARICDETSVFEHHTIEDRVSMQ